MKLSSVQQAAYLASGGTRCPFCENDDLAIIDTSFQRDSIFQIVDCNDCGQEWTDVYELVRFFQMED